MRTGGRLATGWPGLADGFRLGHPRLRLPQRAAGRHSLEGISTSYLNAVGWVCIRHAGPTWTHAARGWSRARRRALGTLLDVASRPPGGMLSVRGRIRKRRSCPGRSCEPHRGGRPAEDVQLAPFGRVCVIYETATPRPDATRPLRPGRHRVVSGSTSFSKTTLVLPRSAGSLALLPPSVPLYTHQPLHPQSSSSRSCGRTATAIRG